MKNLPIQILATRFSWPHPIWNGKSDEEYRAWVEERFILFQKYTLKSIINCYVKPDYWVVLIDSNQAWIAERLNLLIGGNGINYKIASYSGMGLGLTTLLACDGIEYPNNIITTNLDADDCVSADFFAIIRGLNFSNSGNTAISFVSGSQYMPDTDLYFHSSYPNNPFISLQEYCSSPHEAQSVFFRMHAEQADFVRNHIFPRTYYPMWASVIHGGNLANSSLIETNRVAFSDSDLLNKRFGITN